MQVGFESTDRAEPRSNLGNALSFLRAYWNADLSSALAYCAPDSVIDLARSLPIRTPAPISVVLPLMFRDVYVRFKDERFDTHICSTLAGERVVMVEYTASGTLTNECPFKCDYAVIFTFEESRIVKVRAYADTRYVAAQLIG